jgi:hypothetical protein
MYSFLTKNGQTLAFGIGVLFSVIFMVLIASAPSTADLNAEYFTSMTSESARTEALRALTQFDFGIYVTFALVLIATVAAVGFGLYQFIMTLIDNPKSSIRTLAIIVGVVVFFFIGKAIAPTVDSRGVLEASKAFGVSDAQGDFISGAINTTLIVLVISVVALVAAEIRNLFK